MAARRRHGRRPVLGLLALALAAALLCLLLPNVVPAPLGVAALDSSSEAEEQACDNAELPTDGQGHHPPAPKQQKQTQQQRVVDVGARPRTPKLGEVVDNLKSKVPPQAAGAWAQWAAPVAEWARRLGVGPKVEEMVRYGGRALQPGEALAERCKKRRSTTTGADADAAAAGLDACALLDVSWSLGRQLAGATTQASAKAGAWLAQEVPRVPIPLHLVWVDLDVEVSPVTSQDVGALILHQRPFWVVALADALSERLARALHAVPFFDLLINARYDLFYWPDPACPLVHSPDGIVTRAPLTPDGYCAVRPCAQQSSIRGQNSYADINDGAYYCECDLPRKRCRLRAEPLRDFQLLVDEPLASKAFDAQCATSVAYARPPTWASALLPPPLKWLGTEDLLPRYLANLLVGLLLLYLAEPLSESRAFHLCVGAALGLGSGLVLAALLLNHLLRTFKRLQPFSGLATLLSSAATILLFQRFGRESPFLLAQQLLQTLWADTKVMNACTKAAPMDRDAQSSRHPLPPLDQRINHTTPRQQTGAVPRPGVRGARRRAHARARLVHRVGGGGARQARVAPRPLQRAGQPPQGAPALGSVHAAALLPQPGLWRARRPPLPRVGQPRLRGPPPPHVFAPEPRHHQVPRAGAPRARGGRGRQQRLHGAGAGAAPEACAGEPAGDPARAAGRGRPGAV